MNADHPPQAVREALEQIELTGDVEAIRQLDKVWHHKAKAAYDRFRGWI